MASKEHSDLELINEVKTLIDDVIDKIPQKKDMGMSNLGSLIVFGLGCIIGFEMFIFNLFMTSTVMLSVILLGFFFIIGFLIGTYIEKVDSSTKSSNPLSTYY
ncbi:MAG: hypothetical protein AMQ74_01561 [Candidatus Methanofastidiosum methylothiophilum]|uniref:Uncharacterized protein n=1 Tax=Candidatus Methanofastidiosum methylothiophilum TaxID=1705564 RepID=A0A150IVE4_9EURY|nr:MAG: hypothetical protein AMQ74_01561 [Candidatus Methanofastidiosum methylthiophilus]